MIFACGWSYDFAQVKDVIVRCYAACHGFAAHNIF